MNRGFETPARGGRRVALVGALIAVVAIAIVAIVITTVLPRGDRAAATPNSNQANSATAVYGAVDIDLTEPSWVPEAARKVAPGDSLAMDPTVTVAQESDQAFVFVEVSSPKASVKGDTAEELFSFDIDSRKWALVSEEESGSSVVRIYGYVGSSGPKMEALKAGASVKAFGKATYNTAHDAERAPVDQKVAVKAYAIQAEGMGDAAGDAPSAVWAQLESAMEVKGAK